MKQVAEAVGVSEATVSRWESSTIANMRRDRIHALAEILKVRPNFIMTGSNDDPLPKGAIPYIPRPTVCIPLVGVVSCGVPLFAEDNIEGYIDTSIDDITEGETYFWLKAKEDSMINVGIHKGDLLLIRQQNDVDSGSIAVVAVNGEDATLKRIIKKDNAIILQPENASYETRIFIGKEMQDLEIRGKLTLMQKRFY